jgi:hypothetical protein
MSHKLTLVLAGCAAIAGTVLAADIDVSKLPKPSDKKDVTYEKDIKPILQVSCFNCHGAQRPRKGLRMDSLDAILKGSDDGKVITPGKSETSDLVLAASRLDPKTAMPPTPRPRRGGAPGGATNTPPTNAPAGGGMGGPGGGRGPAPKNLTPEEVGLLRAWIDQGAK